MENDSLATLKEQTKQIFEQTFSSFSSKLGAWCSIIAAYPAIAAFIKHVISLDWKQSFLIAIPFYCAFFLMFAGSLCINAYIKIRRRISRLDLDEFRSAKYFCRLGAQYLGRLYEYHRIEALLKEDGATLKKSRFKLVAIGENVKSIQYSSRTPSVPASTQELCHVITAEPRSERHVRVRTEVIRSTPHECLWEIKFIPGLKSGKDIEYYYEQESPPGTFAMNREELAKRDLRFDFIAQEVTFPTEELNMRFVFPKNFEPADLTYDVWAGGGRVRHESEFRRIGEERFFDFGIEEDCMYGELKVAYPLQSTQYLIRWVPGN